MGWGFFKESKPVLTPKRIFCQIRELTAKLILFLHRYEPYGSYHRTSDLKTQNSGLLQPLDPAFGGIFSASAFF
jgi:hypothetical protein